MTHKRLLFSSSVVLLLSVASGLGGWLLLRAHAGFAIVMAALVFQALLLAAAVYVLVNKLLLARLAAFRAALTSINESDDQSARLAGEGTDLFGQLAAVINGILAKHENSHRELRVAHDTLLFRAAHDPLTGLANRRTIMSALTRELARAQREQKPLAVLLIDVDGFKRINEERGAATGDAILRGLGASLKGAVRPYDHLGRYGDDEFLMIVPGCPATEAHRIARRLRETVRAAFAEAALPITVSIGLTVATGDEQAATVVAIADSAIYRAKQSGNDRVEFATVSPPSGRKGQPAWTV